MIVKLRGANVTLGDADLLGVGGEAQVFRHGDTAVKVFHGPPPNASRADVARHHQVVSQKLDKLRAFPSGLPVGVVGPEEIVTDAKGKPVGYAMPVVEGAFDVGRLAQRRFREGKIGNASVCDLFAGLRTTLEALHARNVVAADLNDGNVLFRGDRTFLIDVDSMQFDRFSCTVAHERFLDPRLYGVDLEKVSGAFSDATDWYAFAVMLFSSLLYVHPYGGVHPAYATLLRRAEARWSVLRSDVVYPKSAVPFAVLNDELLSWFSGVFDRDDRAPYPQGALPPTFTRCSCGVEHARRRCPVCTAQVVVAPPVVSRGRCVATTVVRTSGRVLHAEAHGTLRYLLEEDGVVRRENGSVVMRDRVLPGMRFAFSGATTWVGLGNRLSAVRDGAVTSRSSTALFAGEPSFDANARGLVRVHGDHLVDDASGERVGAIVQGQTWVRTGARLAFGFYRAGWMVRFFLFHVGRPGLVEVAIPSPRGRIVEASAAFDERRVLFSLATERDGRRTHELHLVDETGAVRASLAGHPSDARALSAIGGKAVVGDRVLCPTDDGLLLLEADLRLRTFVERTVFDDTRPFSDAGAELLAGDDGSVWVVGTKEITHLVLS